MLTRRHFVGAGFLLPFATSSIAQSATLPFPTDPTVPPRRVPSNLRGNYVFPLPPGWHVRLVAGIFKETAEATEAVVAQWDDGEPASRVQVLTVRYNGPNDTAIWRQVDFAPLGGNMWITSQYIGAQNQSIFFQPVPGLFINRQSFLNGEGKFVIGCSRSQTLLASNFGAHINFNF
jgi:hypothetical protein